MRPVKCNGERCGALLPSHARFCPRCGKAIETLPPTPQKRPTSSRSCGRFPILRFIAICWLVVFLIRLTAHWATHGPVANPTPTPVLVYPARPAPPAPIAEPAPDTSSLERFITWRAGKPSKESRKSVEGQEIRWTGKLKKSLIPGRFELTQADAQNRQSVRLEPVTADAKDDLRRLDSGALIEIDGVLMDERSLHVVSVREVQ